MDLLEIAGSTKIFTITALFCFVTIFFLVLGIKLDQKSRKKTKLAYCAVSTLAGSFTCWFFVEAAPNWHNGLNPKNFGRFEGQEFILYGQEYGAFTEVAVNSLFEQHPNCQDIEAIHVSGPGGKNFVVDTVSRHAKNCSIQKVVASQICASSCTGIWSQFENRIILEGSTFGFHQSSWDWFAPITDWYAPSVFPEHITKFLSQIPHQDMCFLTRQTMIELGMYNPLPTSPYYDSKHPKELEDFIDICEKSSPKTHLTNLRNTIGYTKR